MAELKIGEWLCIQRPLTVKGLELDKDETGKKELYVDAKGNELKKLQMQKAEYSWVVKGTQEPYDGKQFKSFNGKPIKAFTKTKEVKEYDTIDISDINSFVENEKTYQLINPRLKAVLIELAEKNQTISFKYVNSGFKIHRAVLVLHKDVVLMRCFRGDLNKLDLTETDVEELSVQDEVASLDISNIEV